MDLSRFIDIVLAVPSSLGAGATFGLIALIGAIAWRGRGGWFGLGRTQPSRLLGVLPLVMLAWVLSGWPAAVAAAMLFPPLVLGWAEWQDMGTVANNDDVVGMAGRGALQTLPAATGFHYLIGPDVAILYVWVGTTMAGLYWLAKESRHRIRPVVLFGRNLIDGFTSVAELATGAVLYAGFVFLLRLSGGVP